MTTFVVCVSRTCLALHVVVAPLCTGGGAYIFQDRGPPAARLILAHRWVQQVVSFLGFGNTDDSLFRCLVSHLRDTRGKTETPNLNLPANLPAKIHKKRLALQATNEGAHNKL